MSENKMIETLRTHWPLAAERMIYLEAEADRLRKESAADIQTAYKEGFSSGQHELCYPEADRRTAGQAFAASLANMRCKALLFVGEALSEGEANDR